MSEIETRHLDWDGCFNVRDLGGLATEAGGTTRRGALVRADSLGRLTADGWKSLVAHGVQTVVDLRNDDELDEDSAPRPDSLTTIHLPLDVSEDREFWGEWESGPQFGTPLYFAPHLRRFPERNAEIVAAIANAAPGGVAFPLRWRSRPGRPDRDGPARPRRGRARRDRGRLRT
jgi:protein-tyrosine phosphatase